MVFDDNDPGAFLDELDVCAVTERKTPSQSSHPSPTGTELKRASAQKQGSVSQQEQMADDINAKNRPFANLKESVKASLLADSLIKVLAWDDVANAWFSYGSGYWSQISTHKAFKAIKEALDVVVPEGYSLATLRNMETFLKVNLLAGHWNKDRHFLPLRNGILNIKTLMLSEHSPSYRFSWALPFDYAPDVECPVTIQWLKQSTEGGTPARHGRRIIQHSERMLREHRIFWVVVGIKILSC